MDAEIEVLKEPKLIANARFAGLMCLAGGVVSLHLGDTAEAPMLMRPRAMDAATDWTPAGAVLQLPRLFVNVYSGEFAVLLALPDDPPVWAGPLRSVA